jgi:hypothetical protein
VNDNFVPLTDNIILFQDIDFQSLELFRAKKERHIFFHNLEPLVFKFFNKGWEFADKIEQGIKLGFYDQRLVPNFIGLIKGPDGENRGYVCRRFEEEQMLCHYPRKESLKNIVKNVITRKAYLQRLVFPRYKPMRKSLIDLLWLLFSRALKTEIIFIELNPIHVWTDGRGYYIYDLDAQRDFDWLFCEDKSDLEYIRKKSYLDHFNRSLKSLVEYHELKFPFKIMSKHEINPFWESLLKINSINSVSIQLF